MKRIQSVACWALLLSVGLTVGVVRGASAFPGTAADPRDVELLDKLKPGHWVEVRGLLEPGGSFTAQRIELTGPRRDDTLWGIATSGSRPDLLNVLGREVETSANTRWQGGTLASCIGQRVRVRGLRDSRGRIAARRIQIREPGVARIAGRIDHSQRLADGSLELELLGISVVVPAGVKQRTAIPLASLRQAAAPRPHSRAAADLDDFFGDGFIAGETVRFGLQQDVTFSSRTNFELDDRDDTDIDEQDDRDDSASNIRARMVWSPKPRVAAVADVAYRARRRALGEGISETDNRTQLREAYVLFRGLGSGLDLQLGRQDFDDAREWLYDQNLDGVRLLGDSHRLHFELSVSKTLSDGSSRDEDATNAIFYLSNRGRRRHLATYVVHRDFGAERDETQSHVGVRALGRWTDRLRGWAELATLTGNRGARDVTAWGGDLGFSWSSRGPARVTLTLGLAHGSGDDGDTTDQRFRQTGLQDNNGRLGGVSAVRYYGELIDPELSNMSLSTVGIGGRIFNGVSIELIGHGYRQDVASTRLTRTNLDQQPDGIHRDLGTEIDLVIGIRRFERWDIELVGARFATGDAFPEGDDATLGRLQVRYRY